jgi:hypothetical protein
MLVGMAKSEVVQPAVSMATTPAATAPVTARGRRQPRDPNNIASTLVSASSGADVLADRPAGGKT